MPQAAGRVVFVGHEMQHGGAEQANRLGELDQAVHLERCQQGRRVTDVGQGVPLLIGLAAPCAGSRAGFPR